MITFVNPDAALSVSARLTAGGLVIWSLEMAAVRREFERAGIFSTTALTAGTGRLVPVIDRRLNELWLTQSLAGVVLLVIGPFHVVGRIALVLALATHLTVRVRRQLGGDGAEQMATVILFAVAIAAIPTFSELRTELAMWFIASQAVLAYTAAGLAKLISPSWRDGSALPDILSTDAHGWPRIGAILQHRREVALLMSWSVIGFECGMAVILFLPMPVLLGALVVAGGFHLGCALLMGLNSFLWTFPATYPCLVAVGAQIARHCVGCGA